VPELAQEREEWLALSSVALLEGQRMQWWLSPRDLSWW